MMCLLLIWHVLGPLKTFISEREREGAREGGAIHVLLIHSIFVVAFIVFFFFNLRTVYVFWIR